MRGYLVISKAHNFGPYPHLGLKAHTLSLPRYATLEKKKLASTAC